MVKKLRAYFMLYVIAIQWIMCVPEKIERSIMSKRPMLSLSIISGNFSFAATTIMQQ